MKFLYATVALAAILAGVGPGELGAAPGRIYRLVLGDQVRPADATLYCTQGNGIFVCTRTGKRESILVYFTKTRLQVFRAPAGARLARHSGRFSSGSSGESGSRPYQRVPSSRVGQAQAE
jgi:hypothetical protein